MRFGMGICLSALYPTPARGVSAMPADALPPIGCLVTILLMKAKWYGGTKWYEFVLTHTTHSHLVRGTSVYIYARTSYQMPVPVKNLETFILRAPYRSLASAVGWFIPSYCSTRCASLRWRMDSLADDSGIWYISCAWAIHAP